MKRISVYLILCIFSLPLSAQRSADYGVVGGAMSYLGDVSNNRLFYFSPQPAGGFFYRYNLHPRQAIRGNLLLGLLKGGSSFSGTVAEASAQFEFNFLPYSTQGKRWNYTPYIAGGVGIAFLNTNSQINNQPWQPVIPFSIGFKLNIYKNLGLEAEYGFRKTFYDKFDGLNDKVSPDHKAWLHNNDWYSFAGVAFTWKIYSKLVGCPAFKDVDESRRR